MRSGVTRAALSLIPILLAPLSAQTRDEFTIFGGVPRITDSSIAIYQAFFNRVGSVTELRLSDQARKTIRFTEDELRSLFAVTRDLAAQSRIVETGYKRQVWEMRIESIDGEAVGNLQAEEARWGRTILDHVDQVKTTFGEARFRILDDWIHASRSTFVPPPGARPGPDRDAYTLSVGVPSVADESLTAYENFFREVKDLGVLKLSNDARQTLRLSTEELRSLLAITTHLASVSREESSESGWAGAIHDHINQLQAAFGDARFRILDDWVRSGKSMYEEPRPAVQ